jgi:hypothetical protein
MRLCDLDWKPYRVDGSAKRATLLINGRLIEVFAWSDGLYDLYCEVGNKVYYDVDPLNAQCLLNAHAQELTDAP